MEINKPQKLTLQAILGAFLLAVVSELAQWYATTHHGAEFNPTLMALFRHEVVPYLATAIPIAVAGFWARHHNNKTSTKIDVGAILSGLSNAELNAIAKHADAIKADPSNPINTTKDAVLATMARVAEVQSQVPTLGLKDALAVVTNAQKTEVKD